jgi:hypothetical protein
MKKIVWIVVGCFVVFVLVLLISRNKPQDKAEVAPRLQAEQVSENGDKKSDESVEEPSPLLSDAVLTLIDPETDYQTRLGSMRKLGYEIPPHEIDVLMEFLAADIPANVKIPGGAYNSVRNDLYEVLLRQKEMPEGMGSLLVDVVNNPDQDGMWRNYCIQFMQPFYERQFEVESLKSEATSGDVTSSEELSTVRDTLWNALEERDNSNAGTALLGLDKLSRNHSEFDRKDIDAAILDLASDDQASVANRITAIRMCGESGNAQAVEVARVLAQNGDTTMLRCAAIATLGEIGTEEDLAFLETYAVSDDKRIQNIARRSVAKLASIDP